MYFVLHQESLVTLKFNADTRNFFFKGQVILISTRVPYFAKKFGHWCPVILLHEENLLLHTESPWPQVPYWCPLFSEKISVLALIGCPLRKK